MPDPLAPVAAGQPLSISARAWNLVTESARAHRQPPRAVEGGGRGLGWGGVAAVRCVNSTGVDLREGRPAAVTGIGGYELPEGGADWQRQPVLTLGVPAKATDWVCVTLEAIPDGGTGWVAVDGIVLCDVNVGSGGTATYARPTPGTTDSLTGGSRGPIRVLHVPDAEGSTRRCVVYLRESATPQKWLTDFCPVPDGYGGIAGFALFEELADGRGRCRVVGFCEDCDASSVPPPPTYTISGGVASGPPGYTTPEVGRVVTLGGANSGTATTGAGGAYSFSGLSAGSTTVSISSTGLSAGQYTVDGGIPQTGYTATVIPNGFNVVTFRVTVSSPSPPSPPSPPVSPPAVPPAPP